jgi:hypothetical protein
MTYQQQTPHVANDCLTILAIQLIRNATEAYYPIKQIARYHHSRGDRFPVHNGNQTGFDPATSSICIGIAWQKGVCEQLPNSLEARAESKRKLKRQKEMLLPR